MGMRTQKKPEPNATMSLPVLVSSTQPASIQDQKEFWLEELPIRRLGQQK